MGWENKALDRDPFPLQSDELDLEYYSTVEELMEVGPGKLKEVSSLPFTVFLSWQSIQFIILDGPIFFSFILVNTDFSLFQSNLWSYIIY